jgi:O-antigen ligase
VKEPLLKPSSQWRSQVDFQAAAGDYGPTHSTGMFFLLMFLFLGYSRLTDTLFANTYIAFITSLVALIMCIVTGGLSRAFASGIGFWLSAFSVWILLAIPFSFWPGGSVQMLRDVWLKSFLVFPIVAGLPRTAKDCRLVAYSLAAATVSIIVRCLIFGTGSGDDDRLVLGDEGVLTNPNTVAQFVLMGLPFLWFLVMTEKRNVAKYLIAVFGTLGGLVIIGGTGSRGALIALVVLIGIMVLTLSGANKLKLVAGLVFTALLVTPFVSEEQRSRFMTTFGDAPAEMDMTQMSALMSREQRLALLRQSIDVTIHNPLFGAGPGVYDSYSATLPRPEGQKAAWQVTHNSYTQVSSEEGLPALFFFVGVLITCLLSTRRLYKGAITKTQPELGSLAYCLFLSLVTFAVSAFFDSVAYQIYLPTLAGMCVALNTAARTEAAAAEGAKAKIPPFPPSFGSRNRVPSGPAVTA